MSEMSEIEAIDVFKEVKLLLGRKWKEPIWNAWMTGDYSGMEKYASKLQRIRNKFGPTWLHNIRLI